MSSQSINVETATTELDNILEMENVSVAYAGNYAVKNVSFNVARNAITSIIGPSGCGKSTLLRCLNRMNDFILDASIEGNIRFEGQDIYAREVDAVEVRHHMGMVFQKPNPFPKSIFKNVAWGPMVNRYQGSITELVERSLKQASLWDEVKDRLNDSALGLSGGQQQRLCIARALAMEPNVLLMDEPCSALDPISTAHIEDLMFDLKSRYTIVIVTHNMQQASRVSDYTAFMEMGNLIEFDESERLFTRPSNQRTEDYVSGRFG